MVCLDAEGSRTLCTVEAEAVDRTSPAILADDLLLARENGFAAADVIGAGVAANREGDLHGHREW